MEPGIVRAASDLAAGRRQLLSDDHRDMDPAELRQAWLDLHESWLIVKAAQIGIADDSGYAIVGVGGLGRRELLPYSDLDLVLLHDGKPVEELGDVADALWYPLWDAAFGWTTVCAPSRMPWVWPVPTWRPRWACWKPATSSGTNSSRRA